MEGWAPAQVGQDRLVRGEEERAGLKGADWTWVRGR